MKIKQTLKSISFRKESMATIFCLVALLSLPNICWGQNSNSNNKIDRCKTVVAVGVVSVKNKSKSFRIDANSFAKKLSDSLNKGTKIITIPVTDVSNERDFKEKATNLSPDFLLSVALTTDVDKNDVWNVACAAATHRTCRKPEYKYIVKYQLMEVGTNRIAAKTDKPFEAIDENQSIALGEVADQINQNVGDLVRKDSVSSPSLKQLLRRHFCYSRFPAAPSSLIMKFNVKSKDAEIAFDYYIKGNLWRMDVRPIGGSAFITIFDGNAIWTGNEKEGWSVVAINQETNRSRILEFMLGEFLSDASSENLKYEVLTVNLIGKDTINGKSCHVLEARTRGATYIKSFYDAETGALLKKILLDGNKAVQQETNYENYEDVGNGVMFPMSIKTKSADGDAEIAFSKGGILLNPNIQDIMFLRPSGKN